MKYDDLKIGQKVFFISAEHNIPAEEVFITEINGNNTFSIERKGKSVSFEIVEEDGLFNFAISDEKKEPENYGFLYLNLELIDQEERFYNILYDNTNQIENLSLDDKLKLINFLEELLKNKDK